MLVRISTPKPRTPTGGGLPRSTRTSRKRNSSTTRGRVVQAEDERDFLIRELSRAVGLSGRARRAGSASERARVSVTRAIRHALSRIRQHDPPLGDHLDRAIRTGTYCVYLPDTRITASWIT